MPSPWSYLETEEAEAQLEELALLDLNPAEIMRLRKNADKKRRLVIEIAANRQKLRGRIAQPENFFALGEAAQQLTSTPVARWRAQRMDRLLPPGRFMDLGCGLGGDLLELALLREVVAWERDPERLELARLNLRRAGLADRVELRAGDWRTQKLPEATGIFVDPVRRSGGRRIFDPERCDPPLSQLLDRFSAQHLVVKAAPSVNPVAGAEVEYVSLEGSLKEAVLWITPLLGKGRRATRLSWTSSPRTAYSLEQPLPPPPPELPTPPFHLHEPEPAALRAGLLGQLCHQNGLEAFDPRIAYLWSAGPRQHPWLTTFRVTHELDPKTKALARALKELDIGHLEIKKRGVEIDPDRLRKQLKLKGSKGAVLFLTRVERNRRLVYLAERCRRFGVVE